MSKSKSQNSNDVPIYSHTHVLGVDIGDGHGNPRLGTRLNVYPRKSTWGPNVYRDLCDWIRRNQLHV